MHALDRLIGDYQDACARLERACDAAELPSLERGWLCVIPHPELRKESDVRALLGTLGIIEGWVTTQSAHVLLAGSDLPEDSGMLLEGEFITRTGAAALQYLGPAGWQVVEYVEGASAEPGADPVLVEVQRHLAARGAPGMPTYRVYWMLVDGTARVTAAAFGGFAREGAK